MKQGIFMLAKVLPLAHYNVLGNLIFWASHPSCMEVHPTF